jgi:hypothetical protein
MMLFLCWYALLAFAALLEVEEDYSQNLQQEHFTTI